MIRDIQIRTALAAVGLALTIAVCIGTGTDARETSSGKPEIGAKKEGSWQHFKIVPDVELRKRLDPLQYNVTQKNGTEPAFRNEFWDQHEEGLYVDIVSGEPLFSSRDKFDSGTGWPSFTRPLAPEYVSEYEDESLGMRRVEVRSRLADSHLGHVFNDGPEPTGLRYCINSAAMKFIPVDEFKENGYQDFLVLFRPEALQEEAKMNDREIAILAGGCFWGMEDILRDIPGVVDTDVGYAGGEAANPNYQMVHTGSTGHAEAVRIVFDPREIGFEELLGYFFRMHDPTTLNRQGNDRGTQYRSAIFYQNDRQREIAERVKDEVNRSGKWKGEVVTEIAPAGPFTVAEDYHQDYLEKNPNGYSCHYLRD